MLALWRDLFADRILPQAFLDALAPEVLGLVHGDGLLCSGKTGSSTIAGSSAGTSRSATSFSASTGSANRCSVPPVPAPPRPTHRLHRGELPIGPEHRLRLLLFRRDEQLFHDLGFPVRLKASLSAGNSPGRNKGSILKTGSSSPKCSKPVRLRSAPRPAGGGAGDPTTEPCQHDGRFPQGPPGSRLRNAEGDYDDSRDASTGSPFCFGKAFSSVPPRGTVQGDLHRYAAAHGVRLVGAVSRPWDQAGSPREPEGWKRCLL